MRRRQKAAKLKISYILLFISYLEVCTANITKVVTSCACAEVANCSPARPERVVHDFIFCTLLEYESGDETPGGHA